MTGSQTFGRKGRAGAPPQAAAPVRGEAPDPQVEAFRASLKSDAGGREVGEDQAFAAWLRAQRPRRWRLIGIRLAFLAPGLFLFLFNAPMPVSIVVEGAGLVANAWIKTERVRQAREIADWSPEA